MSKVSLLRVSVTTTYNPLQYSSNYTTPTRKSTGMQSQTGNIYATLEAKTESDHDRRGSTSSMASSPASFGSPFSLYTHTGQAATPMTSHSAQARRFSVSSMSQQQVSKIVPDRSLLLPLT